MPVRKVINVGLIGFGTVGSGVHHLIARNGAVLGQRTDLDIRVKTVCDLDITRVKEKAPGVTVVADWKSVVADPEIHTVVELIGGIDPAESIIVESLSAGKNVVTANKKLLAERGERIFALANGGKASLGFEAAVGGGIPCIAALKSGLVGNRILSVMGILNGTTNYILSRMQDESLSFEAALADAQAKGFAEADPTFDVEGYDAGHKIAILSMIAFNKKIDYTAISIEGITRIGAFDIEYAREMGYRIKLLGIGKRAGDRVDIRVHPTMLPLRHPLASVQNEFNAVMITGDMTGPVTLTGKGAGSHPTASAVVSDIVRIAQRPASAAGAIRFDGDASYVPPGERLSRYYMRVHTEDSPGILAKIAGVLAAYGISIASVIQKESDMPHVPLVIMTHEAHEEGLFTAVKKINAFDFVEGDATVIRVEDYVSDGADHE